MRASNNNILNIEGIYQMKANEFMYYMNYILEKEMVDYKKLNKQ